ncbi:Putative flavin carrier protein 3 [Sporothrix curviconia]|uniref:Flavin carrier protein 3 n=1 Tax=Sporothrix curviconia TaxID=1260050 RepID=A0ABP0AVX5_9PEZI
MHRGIYWQVLVAILATALWPVALAEHLLRSTSLNACQDNSQFTASLLNMYYTPDNGSAYVHLIAVSSIEGYAIFDITIAVYGFEFLHRTVDPCQIGLPGLCPMVAAKTDSPPFNLPVNTGAESQIPGIAYTFPDLDAKVRVYINMTSGDQAGTSAACLELDVSNGKTVDLVGVQWASALVILAALVASAVIGQLGHFNAASHVVVHTLALFSYFQAQAMVGLCGMPLPPIVQAWTQDFQWTLGLIRVNFMQAVLTWYQRAMGGTPSRLFDSLSDVSVVVHKRAEPQPQLFLPFSSDLAGGTSTFAKRDLLGQIAGATTSAVHRRAVTTNDSGSFVVFGIQRAAFRAGIEPTNAFLTVLGFFTAMLICAALAVLLTKVLCELAVRMRWITGRSERTLEFRNGWRTILKGVLFRCLLAGFPAVAVFSLYEFTQADSVAEVVDAVVYLVATGGALAYGAYTVIRIASRSIGLHRNPAYILFSDPRTLNKWGCFYVQFRASGYYFSVPVLAHTLLKAIFIAFAQKSGTAQAIGLIVIEAAALVGAIWLRPWMDKSTNSFNIAICVVNFVNAVILLIFSNVFKQPALATGIVGLIFWVLNAAVTLILLLMIIVTTIVIFFRNNPDARYQYMADDRTSFVKSQVHLASNELDALAVTARGGTPANAGGVFGGTAPTNTTLTRDGLRSIHNNNNISHPGLGDKPRDRLLMLDDAGHHNDETESIISDFRHPTLAGYTNVPQRRRMSPTPSSLSRDVGYRDSAGSRNSRLSSRTNNNTTPPNRERDLRDIFPRSPATLSVPMLPAEEHNNSNLRSPPPWHGTAAAYNAMRSPDSPVYGFGGRGSRSARNTPTPMFQDRNPASLSSPMLPSGYRGVDGAADLSRTQNNSR